LGFAISCVLPDVPDDDARSASMSDASELPGEETGPDIGGAPPVDTGPEAGPDNEPGLDGAAESGDETGPDTGP
jgi:hypothetical protein